MFEPASFGFGILVIRICLGFSDSCLKFLLLTPSPSTTLTQAELLPLLPRTPHPKR
jgi:hypothetical protein